MKSWSWDKKMESSTWQCVNPLSNKCSHSDAVTDSSTICFLLQYFPAVHRLLRGQNTVLHLCSSVKGPRILQQIPPHNATRRRMRTVWCLCVWVRVCGLASHWGGQALLHPVSEWPVPWLRCLSENPEQMVREKRVTSARDHRHPTDACLHRQ